MTNDEQKELDKALAVARLTHERMQAGPMAATLETVAIGALIRAIEILARFGADFAEVVAKGYVSAHIAALQARLAAVRWAEAPEVADPQPTGTGDIDYHGLREIYAGAGRDALIDVIVSTTQTARSLADQRDALGDSLDAAHARISELESQLAHAHAVIRETSVLVPRSSPANECTDAERKQYEITIGQLNARIVELETRLAARARGAAIEARQAELWDLAIKGLHDESMARIAELEDEAADLDAHIEAACEAGRDAWPGEGNCAGSLAEWITAFAKNKDARIADLETQLVARKLAWLSNLPEEWQGVWDDIRRRNVDAAGKTPGQVGMEARTGARVARLRLPAPKACTWPRLGSDEQASEEAGAQAVLTTFGPEIARKAAVEALERARRRIGKAESFDVVNKGIDACSVLEDAVFAIIDDEIASLTSGSPADQADLETVASLDTLTIAVRWADSIATTPEQAWSEIVWFLPKAITRAELQTILGHAWKLAETVESRTRAHHESVLAQCGAKQ